MEIVFFKKSIIAHSDRFSKSASDEEKIGGSPFLNL